MSTLYSLPVPVPQRASAYYVLLALRKKKRLRMFVCMADGSTCDAADTYLLLYEVFITSVAMNKEPLFSTVNQK